jgi:hypothetical protein
VQKVVCIWILSFSPWCCGAIVGKILASSAKENY